MILPDEILNSIFSLLPQNHLPPIARVCKKFYQIIQPLLFTTIDLHAKSEVTYRNDAPPAQYESCHLLARTLLDDPPLASLIKNLTMEARHPSLLIEHLSTTNPSSSAQNKNNPPVSFSDLKTLTLGHAQLHPPTLSTLLSLTPALSTLSLDFECDANPFDKYHARFLDCTLLGAALSATTTLVQLKISVSFVTSAALEIDNGGSAEGGDGWGIRGRLGGALRALKGLRVLDVPFCVLLGWGVERAERNYGTGLSLKECLPDGLRELVLAHDLGFFVIYEWGDEGVCVGVMREYLDGRAGDRGGELRSLGVRFSGDYEDEEYPKLDRGLWGGLEEKCREIGCRLWLEGREIA